MKSFSIQLTLGQSLFFTSFLGLIIIVAFYLGAKFGPQVFWGVSLDEIHNASLFPQNSSEEELRNLIATANSPKLVFHEVLSNKISGSLLTTETPTRKIIPTVVENAEVITDFDTKPKVAETPKPVISVAEKKLPPEPTLIEKTIAIKTAEAKTKALETKPATPVAKEIKKETPKAKEPVKPEPAKKAAASQTVKPAVAVVAEKPNFFDEDTKPVTPPNAGQSLPAQKPVAVEGPAIAPVQSQIGERKSGIPFSLQVGSFGSEDKAKEIEHKFQQAGYAVSVKTEEIPSKGTWYRVYVGRYDTIEEAKTKSDLIRNNHGIVPVIVKR